MAVPSFSQFLDNLYTTTWQSRMEGTADNVFNATPFYFWLRDKKKLKPQRGGRFIEEQLEYAANNQISWLQKGSVVDLSDYEFLTIAQYQWRYLAASMVRFGIDDQQNAGKARIISLMNAKMDNTEQALVTEFESRLCGAAGTQTSGTTTAQAPAFDGLFALVSSTPGGSLGTAGNPIAVGGIDSSQATFAWWRNQAQTMAGVSFASSGLQYMRHLLNQCMNNRREDRPDFFLSDQTTYEYYEGIVVQDLRFYNRKLADAGFENQSFKGIPWVWTPVLNGTTVNGVAGGFIFMLNTNFLSLVYDPASWFDMTEWKPIPDQVNDRAAQIISSCTLTTNRRRVQGLLYSINTP